MSKLISIGEALIDFIPNQKNQALKVVTGFTKRAGGAPANVCACVSRLGQQSVMITKLGYDAFGDYIIQTLSDVGVDTRHITQTRKANTGLAFVSLDEQGNRDFTFYRHPSADMLLNKKEIKKQLFKPSDILHFCSVDLIDAPVKLAHKKAISYAKKNGCMVSFDPNVRLALWDNHERYRLTINQFIKKADIIKISDEELEFITGKKDILEALPLLFVGDVKIVVFTSGSKGATVYTKNKTFNHTGFPVEAIDTTGAGDAFIGAFLASLLKQKITKNDLSLLDYTNHLVYSNAVGAIVASKKGAIPSMPHEEEVKDFIKLRTLDK